MNNLKKAVMAIYGIAMLGLSVLVGLVKLNIAENLYEFFSFMTVLLFVSASLFGAFGLFKRTTKIQQLYSNLRNGMAAVSIFTLSTLVAMRSWHDLVTLIQLAIW